MSFINPRATKCDACYHDYNRKCYPEADSWVHLGCALHSDYPRVKLPEIYKIIEDNIPCNISYNPKELEKPKSEGE